MKLRITSLVAALIGAASLLTLSGCAGMGFALSTQQQAAAGVKAVGRAGGAALLTAHLTNGAVDTAFLAQYEANIPKVAGYMQGQITPADFGNLIKQVKSNVSPTDAAVLGLLGSLGGDFPTLAKGTGTGVLVNLECQQLAVGLADAVGQVTGVNFVYTPPGS
jgi:hypothetical protein